MTFDQAVNVTGTPLLALATSPSRTASYAGGSGTPTLTFTYTVATGDSCADLDYVSTAALTLNGGSIKNSANENAALTLPAPGAANSLGANKNIVIDGVPPVVTNVTSSDADGLYGPGTVIHITVQFSEAVTVVGAGTPTLSLAVGSPVQRSALYGSGSGTSVLTFEYLVSPGDVSADLAYDGTGALKLNGASIRDAAGNNAVLTLPVPGEAGSLGANKNIVIDTAPPSVAVEGFSNGDTIRQPYTPVNAVVTDGGSGVATATVSIARAPASGTGPTEYWTSAGWREGFGCQPTTHVSGTTVWHFGWQIEPPAQDGSEYRYTLSAQATDTAGNPASATAVTGIIVDTRQTILGSAGTGGSISPETTMVPWDGGATFAITPGTGYHIADVLVDGESVGTPASYTFTHVQQFTTIDASFAIDTFQLHYAAGEHGTLSGETSQTVEYGDDGTAVTANPAGGWHFDGWSDGSTANPRQDTEVTATVDVTAAFAVDISATATLTIDGGAEYTGSAAATLTPEASGATQMRFRNNGASWSDWEAYSGADKPWTLTAGPDGLRTVSAEFRDSTLTTVSAVDTITLDTAAPTVTISSPSDGGTTADDTPLLTYAIDGVAAGPPLTGPSGPPPGSPIVGVVVNVDGVPVAKVSGAELDHLVDGQHRVEVLARDAADNEGSAVASFTVDTSDRTPPTVRIEQAAGQDDPTLDASGIRFAVTFSEEVTGLAASDFVVGGTAKGFVVSGLEGDGTAYVATVSGDPNLATAGTVILSLPEGQVKDLAGNDNTASVSDDNTVTYDVVESDAAPVIVVPDRVVVEATSARGAIVRFGPLITVTDDLDTRPRWTAMPRSGSWFPLGTTIVTVMAADGAGNVSTATFPVIVEDTVGPTITVAGSRTFAATGPDGVVVTAAMVGATARDRVDGVVPVAYQPALPAPFALGGPTVLIVRAEDTHGNAVETAVVLRVAYSWSMWVEPSRPTYRAGDTVRVAFKLARRLTTAVALLTVTGPDAEELITEQPFTYSARANEYRFLVGLSYGLQTTGWARGQYTLKADLGDGVLHTTGFRLR